MDEKVKRRDTPQSAAPRRSFISWLPPRKPPDCRPDTGRRCAFTAKPGSFRDFGRFGGTISRFPYRGSPARTERTGNIKCAFYPVNSVWITFCQNDETAFALSYTGVARSLFFQKR